MSRDEMMKALREIAALPGGGSAMLEARTILLHKAATFLADAVLCLPSPGASLDCMSDAREALEGAKMLCEASQVGAK